MIVRFAIPCRSHTESLIAGETLHGLRRAIEAGWADADQATCLSQKAPVQQEASIHSGPALSEIRIRYIMEYIYMGKFNGLAVSADERLQWSALNSIPLPLRASSNAFIAAHARWFGPPRGCARVRLPSPSMA
jgi:hypothetical protein